MAESSVEMAPAPPSGLSALFSLSQAAASSPPIPISIDQRASKDAVLSASSGKAAHMKHRRLSSTGQMRRRVSEARDAASRPSCVFLLTLSKAYIHPHLIYVWNVG